VASVTRASVGWSSVVGSSVDGASVGEESVVVAGVSFPSPPSVTPSSSWIATLSVTN
jgi:hypothetical protein